MNASDEMPFPAAEAPAPIAQGALTFAGSDLIGQLGVGVSVACCVILMLAIAVIDKLTGYELRLRILHLIPVAIVTWAAGRSWGMLLSTVAIAIWVASFRNSPGAPSNAFLYWDGAVALATFFLVVIVLARLREELESANTRFSSVLEQIEAPAFVVDFARGELLYGNRRFRDAYAGRSWQEMSAIQARECGLRWFNGRPVILRVITGVSPSSSRPYPHR